MRKGVFYFSLLVFSFSRFTASAQDDAPPQKQMAFYGVDTDTAHHRRDSIFHIDSAHIAIQGALGVAYNSSMKGLINQLNNNSQGPVGQYGGSYISRHTQPGVTYNLGFDYVTRLYWNRIFFSAGIEVFKFDCSGYVHQILNNVSDTFSYTITVLALDVPLHAYCRLVSTDKLRLSLGIGASVGFFVAQNSSSEISDQFNLTNPVNVGSLSLRFDVALSKRTWLAFEPYFAGQLFDPITHIEMAGLRVELL